MTNITLSIDDDVYKKMRAYSEIKWSEYVRKIIEMRIAELDKIEKLPQHESILNMLASEKSLKKDWDNEADERWNNV
ncbi:MAG: hypothetical protein AABW80_05045 [Nanoarchaeota archaeon]